METDKQKGIPLDKLLAAADLLDRDYGYPRSIDVKIDPDTGVVTIDYRRLDLLVRKDVNHLDEIK